MARNGFVDYTGETVGSYQVEKIVLHRPVSTRYLAKNDQAESVYIEVLNVTPDEDADLDGRFQKQMDCLQKQAYPGVAPVLDIGHTSLNHAYAVSQYTPGLTLAQQLADWRETESRLSVQPALALVQKIAAILGQAHTDDIYHADLCPENIVLDEDEQPVLYGLGVPYQPQPEQPIERVQMLDYIPPEQRQGKPISSRSNIYSLGVILYELLVGHRPEIPQSSWDIFERTTLPKEVPLEEARPGLAAETYDLVKTSLWRQEWSRYDTVDGLITAVAEAQEAERLKAQKPDVSLQIPRWLYFAGPALLFLIVLIIVLLSRGSSDDGQVTAVPTFDSAVVQTPGFVLATSTPTLTPTSVPTAQQTAAPLSTSQITLLAPNNGFQFSQSDTIIFDWVWEIPLETGQRFVVKQVSVDDMILGAVNRPISDSQYRLIVEAMTVGLQPGTYQWIVVLETNSGTEIVRSDSRQFTIQPEATATATATAATPQLSPTSTAAQCVVSPPPGWTSYTVQENDYLFNLALDTGTTVERLQEVNCLTTPALGVGQRLWLPVLPPTTTPTPAPTATPSSSGSDDGGGSSDGSGPKPKPTKTAPPPPPL